MPDPDWEKIRLKVKGMRQPALDLYKKQLRQYMGTASLGRKDYIISKIRNIPELSDLTRVELKPTTPTTPKLATTPERQLKPWEFTKDMPLWQNALRGFALPFAAIQEYGITPLAAMATAPAYESTLTSAQKAMRGTQGLGAFMPGGAQREAYEQWQSPWGVKFLAENAPWLLVPGIGAVARGTGIAGRLATQAPKMGRFAPVAKGVAAGLEWSPWGVTEKATGKVLGAGVSTVRKVGGKVITPTVGKVMELPSAQELAEAVRTNVLSPKLLAIPGIRKVVGAVKFALTADDPIKEARVVAGQMQDMVDAGTTLALAKAKRINPGIKVKDNIVIDPNIIQKLDLPTPGVPKSMAFHDVVEYADRYTMSPAQKTYIDELREVSRAFTAMADKEKLFDLYKIKKIKGESDWVYLHRLVSSVKEDATKPLAELVSTQLAKEGKTLIQAKDESAWAYLTRVMDDVNTGKLKPNAEMEALIDKIGLLNDISPVKNRIDKPRHFATVGEALKAGVKYADDPLQELESQGRAIYGLAVKKRVGELLSQGVGTVSKEQLIARELGATPTELTANVKMATKLRDVVNRAIRGESLPPATLKQLRDKLPVLAARLDEALKLKPESVDKILTDMGKELRIALKTDPTELKRVVKLISEIETTWRGKTEVTMTDIADAITNLNISKGITARLITQGYRETYKANKVLLRSTLLDLSRTVKTEVREAQRKVAEAEKIWEQFATTPEKGQVIGVPGVSGKIIPSQFIGGEMREGRAIAEEIRKYFAWAPKGEAEKFVAKVGTIGGIMRMGKASLDLSAQSIQTLGVLGFDTFNALTAPLYYVGIKNIPIFGMVRAPSAAWAKGAVAGIKTAFDRSMRYEAGYWAKPENQFFLQEAAKYGALAQPAELVEAYGPASRWLAKRPVVGKFLSEAARQSYGRAEAAFTATRNITANEYRKAMWNSAIISGKFPEMVKASNLLTGVLSTQGMGQSQFLRNLESGFLFFSPRFTRASGAVIGNVVWNPRSWTGREALKALTGLMVGTTAFFSLASLAMGQKPRIDPRPESEGGDGAKWNTVKIGDRYIGLGGMQSDIRALVNIISQASDDPNELLQFDMSNPVFARLRAKFAPPTAYIYDYLGGHDYIGNPTRGESLMPTKESIFELGRWGLPVWVEGMVDEGFSLPGVIAEFFGGRTFPESEWGIYKNRMLELSGKKRYDDIPFSDRAALERKYPELAELKKVATDEMERRGYNPLGSEYWNRRSDFREKRILLLREAQKRYDAGLMRGSEVRELIQDTGLQLGAEYKVLETDPRYASVMSEMAERALDKTAQALEKGWAVDLAYRQYWQIMFASDLVDELGQLDYAERDRRLNALRAEVGEKVWDKLQEGVKASRQNYPLIVRQYDYAQEVLKPYWNIENEIWAKYPPELRQIAKQVSVLEETDKRRALLLLRQYPDILYIRRLIAVEKKRMRYYNPKIREQLDKFY